MATSYDLHIKSKIPQRKEAEQSMSKKEGNNENYGVTDYGNTPEGDSSPGVNIEPVGSSSTDDKREVYTPSVNTDAANNVPDTSLNMEMGQLPTMSEHNQDNEDDHWAALSPKNRKFSKDSETDKSVLNESNLTDEDKSKSKNVERLSKELNLDNEKHLVNDSHPDTDNVAMEEFDESELLSPRFKEVDLPSSRGADVKAEKSKLAVSNKDDEVVKENEDLGLAELDPSDIMTPRGMPMGRILQTPKNDPGIEL